ncbi:hypothetical protein [uncultured Cohaesibacter sp.]|uniref:hypothetical protein n=1 Tax=uncultured Cohaesibacter sp. TaxID=1002546 RepID=UPI00292F4494|nr:hypothetical protein [uncultured Cohaesibacter sp.]
MSRAMQKTSLTWDIDVPLATNRVVLRQLSLIIIIPAAVVALFMLVLGIIDNEPAEMKAAFYIFFGGIGVLLFLVAVAVLLVFGNRMRMSFILDKDGVRSLVIDRKASVGRILAVLFGFLTINPTLAGAGLIAHGNRGRTTPWGDIRKLELLPDQKTIVLHGKRLVLDAVFCRDESFDEVLDFVKHHLSARQ